MKTDDPPIKGICYLVGAGPGDPGLLTVRAKELISTADVIFYDYLCSPAVLESARRDADIRYVGKKAGKHAVPQGELNALMVEHAAAGRRVVRLKGGDPFVFGRGGEEAQALAASGVSFEVVPGISSSVAGPAYAGIPVTHRDHCSQMTVLTGHEDPSKRESNLDFQQLASTPGTRIFLMGVERAEAIASKLVSHGAAEATPVAMIRWATTGLQKTLVSTLGGLGDDLRRSGFKPPAVMVVGSVVELRRELEWFENRPLHGRRVVVTRTRAQAGGLSARLRSLGAEVYELPVIRIEPPADLGMMRRMVRDAHHYDWIVFTSPNGVEAFFEMFYAEFSDARCLGGAKIAVIGPGTARKVAGYRLAVDLVPDEYVAEGLLEKFQQTESVEHLKILLPRAEDVREVLADGLSDLGAIVDEVAVYRTVPDDRHAPGVLRRMGEEGADWITFTSSSTVENYLKLALPWPEEMKAASIGPVTTATLAAHGLKPAIEAARHDIDGLVDAILSAQ